MIAMNFSNVAEKCEGRLLNAKFAEAEFAGIGIDSRTVKTDQLFIAIKGDKNDGHEYLANAVERNCAGLMINNDFAPAWEFQGKVPVVIVDDTHQAMLQLAAQRRNELRAKIIGITGSNGKTTTKDLTYEILALKSGNVYKSPGNYNNLFGLPLAIFEMPEDTEYAVLELGISLKGEMTRLAKVARPDLIVITNVGPTHLETLGTIEGVAEAKFELVDASDADVPIILNADDKNLMTAAKNREREFLTFGFDNEANYQGMISHISRSGCPEIFIEGRKVSVQLFGLHQAYNLLAGYAIARTLDIDVTPDDLNSIRFMTELYRGELDQADGLTFIADCYNANPVSMKSGLRSFKQFLELNPDKYSRSVAVIGDMLELGPETDKYHTEIGELLALLKFDIYVVIGSLSEIIYDSALKAGLDKDKISHYVDVSQAGNQLVDKVQQGDVIYLKASRGIGLEKIITQLKGTALRQN